jgi:site-specific DNA-methyltransferase (cytosine-N4-specific)
VAETLGRRWLSIEIDRAYSALSAIRFLEGRDTASIRKTIAQIEAGDSPMIKQSIPAVQPVLFA